MEFFLVRIFPNSVRIRENTGHKKLSISTLSIQWLQASAWNFFKKETSFYCEFCEIFKNTFFTEHHRATASEDSQKFSKISFQIDSAIKGFAACLTLKHSRSQALKTSDFNRKCSLVYIKPFYTCVAMPIESSHWFTPEINVTGFWWHVTLDRNGLSITRVSLCIILEERFHGSNYDTEQKTTKKTRENRDLSFV